jgi:hypothetical protein
VNTAGTLRCSAAQPLDNDAFEDDCKHAAFIVANEKTVPIKRLQVRLYLTVTIGVTVAAASMHVVNEKD